MSGGQNNQNAMHELKTSEPAESAVRSIGIVVPLLREELWLLCKALRQDAERIEEQAAKWRTEANERRVLGQTWMPHIKTAICAEGKARRMNDRVKELKAIFYGNRHNGKGQR